MPSLVRIEIGNLYNYAVAIAGRLWIMLYRSDSSELPRISSDYSAVCATLCVCIRKKIIIIKSQYRAKSSLEHPISINIGFSAIACTPILIYELVFVLWSRVIFDRRHPTAASMLVTIGRHPTNKNIEGEDGTHTYSLRRLICRAQTHIVIIHTEIYNGDWGRSLWSLNTIGIEINAILWSSGERSSARASKVEPWLEFFMYTNSNSYSLCVS